MRGGTYLLRAAISTAAVACSLAGAGSAAAAITMTEGTNTVSTSKFNINFADGGNNVERVDTITWRNSGGTESGNLAANGNGSGCGAPSEFWGQSYADSDSQYPFPIVVGHVGSWFPRGARTLQIDSSTPPSCNGNDTVTPVRTRYTFFDSGPEANMIRVERRWGFDANSPAYSNPAGGLRAYVPRLSAGTYHQVIYPNADGTALVTDSASGPSYAASWNGTWVALHHPSSGGGDLARGIVILRDPGNASPARIVKDSDGASSSNLSGISLTKPVGGWKAPLEEVEYLCFYDQNSWTPAANTLPPGCAPVAVPINNTLPTIAGGAGNPRPGVQLTASPGSWDNSTGSFTYQWIRCSSISSCQPIAGATGQTYTPTGSDSGLTIKVAVTATALGSGLTETVESNLAGSISGKVYGSVVSPGTALAGARVMACRTISLQGCRTTVTDASGFYRLQVPVSGEYKLNVYPPAGSSAIAGGRSGVTVLDEQETTNQDVILRPPGPPPPSVSISGSGYRGNTGGGGVATIHWQQPVVIRVRVKDIDWDVTGQITFPDGQPPIPLTPILPPTPDPQPGFPDGGYFDFPVPPTQPAHGGGSVDFDFEEDPSDPDPTDPDPDDGDPDTPPEDPSFPIYIDPSGFVRDTAGKGLVGATVVLLRSDIAAGPFTVVPDGSAVMSPMNRKNPDVTDATGHFGWDVLEGYYKVRVSKPGCHAPGKPGQATVETQVYEIPPPVTNLDIRLDCRRPAKLKLKKNAGRVRVTRNGAYTLGGSKATCPADATKGCVVTLVVKSAKKGKLGSFKLKVPKGKTLKLRGKLSRKGLAKLVKAKSLAVTIAIRAPLPGRATARGTVKATLLAPKPKPRN